MTAPTPTPPAKFTTPEDVAARYVDGTYPLEAKREWTQRRIVDVESSLIGLVPSLGTTPVDQLDPTRVLRVVALVADKVLDLYENPRGATSKTSGMDGFSETEQYRATTTSQKIWFSEQELASVRPPKKRRSQLGTFGAKPWGVPC
ncbi:hypothetical protein A5717_26000 [Mycolicibacterium porcinum]|uniref:hypothetical protein n=1 Tax=Mycolicibacterium porcinum TaxID=39693 RepID=UPI00080B350B|nr:hypothetical protein [Mycolicibacterium porcinum]OCB09231.1 hypothetical protein A5717_26000 [Mycolicibacterium porcinum]